MPEDWFILQDLPPADPTRKILSEPEAWLLALLKHLTAESPMDLIRVRNVSGAIRAGTYRSDPRRMADKLIRMELFLP